MALTKRIQRLVTVLLVAMATAEAGNLTKRATLPSAARQDILDDFISQGSELVAQLYQTEDDLVTSTEAECRTEVSFDDLHGPDSEWLASAREDVPAGKMEEIVPYLEGLVGVEGWKEQGRQVTVKFVGDVWQDTTWSQSKRFGGEGDSEPTNAWYRSVRSYDNGVLVMMGFQSPLEALEEEGCNVQLASLALPKLEYCSDVAFLDYADGWRKQFRERPDLTTETQPPTWILVKAVEEDFDTASVISYCLQSHGQELGAWPGITFPIGTQCHRALLATRGSDEAAMFLVNHKYRFGVAVLGSVTIFQETDGSVSLLWWATKADIGQIVKAEESNKEYEERSPGGVKFPFSLKPRYRPGVGAS